MATDTLSLTFAALAHPARRAILARLSQGETTVGELAEPLKISAPAITKHLKSLERGGLIRRSRNAQWRPCTLDIKSMEKASDWIAHIRAETELRLDRLDAYLQSLQVAQKKTAARKTINRKPKGKRS
jgi:DNA-binding transcriptional ArsR family regulator